MQRPVILFSQIFNFRLEDKTTFGTISEEEEHFSSLYCNITALKTNSYVKLPTYLVDLKRFYPYVEDLKTNIFKFKTSTISLSQVIFDEMKQDFANFKKVRHEYTNTLLL